MSGRTINGLPDGWSIHYSKSQQREYYFNKKDNQRYWIDEDLPKGWSHEYIGQEKVYFHIGNKQNTTTRNKPQKNESRERNQLPILSEPVEPVVTKISTPHGEISSPIVRSSTNKRKFINILNACTEDTTVTGTSNDRGQDQEAAASFYDNLKRNNQSERGDSLMFHLRALNNWVKTRLIAKHSPNQPHVLDLACGKGGDLTKWFRHRIRSYLGVDLALQSLYDAVDRVKEKQDRFDIRFAQADLGSIDFRHDQVQCWTRQDQWHSNTILTRQVTAFDVISMQFALHYIFGEKSRTHLFFRTIRDLLIPGGYFLATTVDPNVVVQHLYRNQGRFDENGNPLPIQFFDEKNRESCRITFDEASRQRILNGEYDQEAEPYGLRYDFLLRDSKEQGEAVNAPEYLVPNSLLQQLVTMYDMEIVLQTNFHSFVRENMKDSDGIRVMDRMHVLDFTGSLSSVEWKIAHLYQVLVFRRKN